MEIAEEEREVLEFKAATHTYLYTLPGGGSTSSRPNRWYVSSRHAYWIRDVAMSVPGLAADHNGISIRIGAPHHAVRVRNPRRVHPFLGCAYTAVLRAIIATNAQAQLQADATISVPTSDYIRAWSLAV